MTLYEFKMLDNDAQANAVWNGVFLTSRTEGTLSILLYDLGGFYVEVYYGADDNRIEGLRPFRTTRVLEPYLTQLNIKDLL